MSRKSVVRMVPSAARALLAEESISRRMLDIQYLTKKIKKGFGALPSMH